MRVEINDDLCEANAYCMKECPEVFRVEEDDTVTLLVQEPDESLREKVMLAARLCPRGAITVSD